MQMNPISIDLLQQFFTLARGRSEDELEDCLSDFPDDYEEGEEWKAICEEQRHEGHMQSMRQETAAG